jgi:hypothetical protein
LATVKRQATQIQKVSAQLELNKPASQVASYEQSSADITGDAFFRGAYAPRLHVSAPSPKRLHMRQCRRAR